MLALIALAGCYTRYPAQWGALEPAQPGCTQISGRYEAFTPDRSRSLAPRILESEQVDLPNAAWVELNVTDDVLAIAVHSQDTMLVGKQLSAAEGEYRCIDGRIALSHFRADGWGARRNRALLAKTQAGELIVEDAGEGLGFYVIPIAGSEYIRFRRYDRTDPASSSD